MPPARGPSTIEALWVSRNFVISAANFPDHLAYFNVLAGAEPEHLLVDSDLDWGQDVNRVASELRPPDIGTGR